jgi:hypothetical protein
MEKPLHPQASVGEWRMDNKGMQNSQRLKKE